MSGRTGIALLAAGASRRLGRPKQLVESGGVSLLRRATLAALATRCDVVAVVLGFARSEIEPALAGLDVEVVENESFREGIASSIRAAARWAEQRDLAALVLAVVDQPRLGTAELDALLAVHERGLRRAAARYAGVLGTPALFPRSDFAALGRLAGDRGARELLRGAPDTVPVDWSDGADDVDVAADVGRITAR